MQSKSWFPGWWSYSLLSTHFGYKTKTFPYPFWAPAAFQWLIRGLSTILQVTLVGSMCGFGLRRSQEKTTLTPSQSIPAVQGQVLEQLVTVGDGGGPLTAGRVVGS